MSRGIGSILPALTNLTAAEPGTEVLQVAFEASVDGTSLSNAHRLVPRGMTWDFAGKCALNWKNFSPWFTRVNVVSQAHVPSRRLTRGLLALLTDG